MKVRFNHRMNVKGKVFAPGDVADIDDKTAERFIPYGYLEVEVPTESDEAGSPEDAPNRAIEGAPTRGSKSKKSSKK